MTDAHSRFVSALEAEYEAVLADHVAAGEQVAVAHIRAFEHAKLRGTEALEQLRAAGIYPWDCSPDGPAEVPHAGGSEMRDTDPAGPVPELALRDEGEAGHVV